MKAKQVIVQRQFWNNRKQSWKVLQGDLDVDAEYWIFPQLKDYKLSRHLEITVVRVLAAPQEDTAFFVFVFWIRVVIVAMWLEEYRSDHW